MRVKFDAAVRALLLAAAVTASVVAINAQQPSRAEERIGDGIMVTVLPKDAIPAIYNPEFISREQAEPLMDDDEPVLGLVDPQTGQARAYSLWHLDRHEIVNDRLGGKPIAVTW
jgi:hypothetical protein